MNIIEIPYSNKAKYLGMTLDTKFRWKAQRKDKKRRTRHSLQMYVLVNWKKFATINIQHIAWLNVFKSKRYYVIVM